MHALLGLLALLFFCQALIGEVQVTHQSGERLQLHFVTPAPKIKSVSIGNAQASKIVVSDLRNELPPGFPEIPTSAYLIAIPEGKTPRIVLVRGKRVSLPLKAELSFLESIQNHCGSAERASKNKEAYSKTYGEQLFEIEEVGFAASDKLARIRFWPFRYQGSRNHLEWAQEIDVEIQFDSVKKQQKPVVSAKSLSIASYVALNSETFGKPISKVGEKVDLVIAHSSHRDTLKRYLDYKRSLGREVREVYVEKTTGLQVKEIIKSQYGSTTPPTGTLLVGHIDQIPSWPGSGDNRWTDYAYTVLDSDDFPDISLGRVPVHNSDELNAFIDKAIAREKEPRQTENVLLTAGRDQSLGCPANVTKVGQKLKTGMPEANLIRKYKTEVSTQEVLEAYNQDPNIIVYDGHGNRQGMTEIPLVIASLQELKNRTYPLILDIACLNANWGSQANPRNFAEMILVAQFSGAAGIMASGGSGYGHDFFQSIGSIMGKASQQIRTDRKMNQIGQVILAAKLQHGKQDKTYWNYYGDPTSSVWDSTWE
ncbi:hypothetical protein EBR78_01945 [bacterium]|nr:hypothetical protein [bacterium]